LKKAIAHCHKEDARAHKAFEVEKERLIAAAKGGCQSDGMAGEVLPKHQRKTAGKPALCRPMAQSREAIAKVFNAEDSYFVSEYRHNAWWKDVTQDQRKQLKEHVRPLDGWTMFRDRAAKYGKNVRFPICTY
jgi:hypothetical protein